MQRYKTYDAPHKGLRNGLWRDPLTPGNPMPRLFPERVTQLLPWQHFSDEELHAHRGEVMAGMPPSTLLIWFEFIIPAQTRAERIALLTGFKQMAPPVFFAEGMGVVRKVLPASEYKDLETKLK